MLHSYIGLINAKQIKQSVTLSYEKSYYQEVPLQQAVCALVQLVNVI